MRYNNYKVRQMSVLIFAAGLCLLSGCGGRQEQEKAADSPVTSQAVSAELENPAADGRVVDYEKEKLLRLGEYKNIELDSEDLENEAFTRKEMAAELAWETLTEDSVIFQLPKQLVSEEFMDQKRRYGEMAAEMEGKEKELFLEHFMGDESLQRAAEEQVKQRMIAKTIVAKEKLKVSDAIYRDYLEEIMQIGKKQAAKQNLDELEKEYRQDYSMRPRDDMLIEIAKNYVGSLACS